MPASMPRVAVIGGGPAGLMAAEVLSAGGAQVELFDAMPSVGRKFLLAGIGGMNITHSETFEPFVSRYRERREQVAGWLRAFDGPALREWIHGLGIDTFVGSSGRVFPRDMKAAPLLRAWLRRLRESGVQIHTRQRWLGWNADGSLRLAGPQGEQALAFDACVLALGGGSWPKLGSDGRWLELLSSHGIACQPLQPANCGFVGSGWSEHLRSRFAGAPLKNIRLGLDGGPLQRGEFILTAQGVEGSLVYALSAQIRQTIAQQGRALLQLDLLADLDLPRLTERLTRPRGRLSLARHLQRQIGLDGVKAALLRELAEPQAFDDMTLLAQRIKQLPLPLLHAQPLDEAISSSGGLCFSALTPQLMLKSLPGTFCAGEMLDWEAPTGGYLLTACFASGRVAAQGALQWLSAQNHHAATPLPPET